MEPVNLTDDQRLYLQAIFDYFNTNGEWPTGRYLEQTLFQTHPDLDVDEVSSSIPEDITPVLSNGKVILSVPAIYLCQGSANLLRTFVSVIRLCFDIYTRSPDDRRPHISSNDLTSHYPLWRNLSIRKVGLLLQLEHEIFTPCTTDDERIWRYYISRKILRFRGVQTIEEYLQKGDMSKEMTNHPAILPVKSSVMVSEDLQLYPDICSKCWDLYTVGKYDEAILNATKALEVAVRTKAGLANDVVGAALINKAFKPDKPILRYSKVEAEQEGMMSLLRGIIQVFKNPQSHRFVGVQDKSECLSVLLMCSNLLYVVDNTEFVG